MAREGAQKLKEISCIHADAYQTSELTHGPLALITAEMPTVAVSPGDDPTSQNVAYHAALAQGHGIDKPRNLATSVTVEEVQASWRLQHRDISGADRLSTRFVTCAPEKSGCRSDEPGAGGLRTAKIPVPEVRGPAMQRRVTSSAAQPTSR